MDVCDIFPTTCMRMPYHAPHERNGGIIPCSNSDLEKHFFLENKWNTIIFGTRRLFVAIWRTATWKTINWMHSTYFLGTGKSINLLDTFFLSINQRELVNFFLDPSALWNAAVALADTYMIEWCDANAGKRSKSIKWATKSSKIKCFFARHVIQATWDCFVAAEATKWFHIYWLVHSPHHSILLTGWLV